MGAIWIRLPPKNDTLTLPIMDFKNTTAPPSYNETIASDHLVVAPAVATATPIQLPNTMTASQLLNSLTAANNPAIAVNTTTRVYHQTCVVLGETGAGKSTFINMCCNAFAPVSPSYDNPLVVIPTKYLNQNTMFQCKPVERDAKNQSSAQTIRCTSYKFPIRVPNVTADADDDTDDDDDHFSLVYPNTASSTSTSTDTDTYFEVIDTPGLNDTAGLARDDENITDILQTVANVPVISAIVLVVNGTQARVTSSMRYLIRRFQGMLPDTVLKNIIVVCTMCTADTCNIDTNSLGIHVEPQNVFCMNNTAFSMAAKEWKHPRLIAVDWQISIETCLEVARLVSLLAVVSTNEVARIQELRSKIRANLHNVRLQIQALQRAQDELEKIRQDLADGSMKIADYDIRINGVNIELQRVVATPGSKHTNCTQCNRTCHINCTLNELPRGTHGFQRCWAFNDRANCTQCGCGVQTHYHSGQYIDTRTVSLAAELTRLQQERVSHETQAQTTQGKLSQFQLTEAFLENMIKNIQKEVQEYCQEIRQHCSGFNFVDELILMISQMENENRNITTVKTRATADAVVAAFKMLCDKLHPDAVSSASDVNDMDEGNTAKSMETLMKTSSKPESKPPKRSFWQKLLGQKSHAV